MSLRIDALGVVVVPVALLLMTSGCRSDGRPSLAPSSTTSPSTGRVDDVDERCPALSFEVPDGYKLAETLVSDALPGPNGVRMTYKEIDGTHEISALAGIESVSLQQGDIISRTDLNGHEVVLRRYGERPSFSALWRESPEGSACSQYAILAGGLSEKQLRVVLSTVRVGD